MGKEDAAKRTRFSVEHLVAVLKQAEMGTPVSDLIRHLGIAEQTFFTAGSSGTPGWSPIRSGSSNSCRTRTPS
jgi:putative transposase